MAALLRSPLALFTACTAAAVASGSLVHMYWPAPSATPGPSPVLNQSAPVSPPSPAAVSALSMAQFAQFVEFLRVDAATQGISIATFEQAFAGLTPDPEVIELASAQPEYVKTAGEYISQLVSDARLTAGRQKLDEIATTLAAVEARCGVDRHVVLAIWGIESNFGGGMGVRSVIRSLATLASFDSRRPEFWRNELLAALRMLQTGEAKPADLVGSWAGAMGHTQFMPSTYAKHAVDFDRDGRRDIWTTVPDALASSANYLKASGWVTGLPWGFEVRLPSGFDFGLSTPGVTNTWAQWQALGLVASRSDAPAVPGSMPALQLVIPSGAKGPAFLVGDNFRAILKYNNSTSYALAVGHLADRLAGRPEFATPWPPGDRALGRSERDEIQRRLMALGFDTGGVDGVIGNGTKAAIRLFQKTRALPEDGHADLALLERLRQEGGR